MAHAPDRPCDCTRRSFLKGALSATAGAAAFGALGPLARLARAQELNPDAPDLYHIFCYFSGGWDTLLSLDPRDPSEFHNGNLRTTRIQPAYDQLVGSDGRLVEVESSRGARFTFGPHIGGLAQHVDRLAVVRGMSMETLTHEVGRRRFLTGVPPSGLQARGSSAATWIADRLGGGDPIPNLSLQVESYNRSLAHYATALRVNSVADLLRALRPSEPLLATRLDQQIDAHLTDGALCPAASKSPIWGAGEAARGKARGMVGRGYADRFDFGARTDEMAALRDHYGITGNATVGTPEVQAAFAARAITGGVSRCVSIRVASALDTHYNNWATDQGPEQERGFNAVARLVDDLAARPYPGGTGESWLDHTTILGFSEFSRTALLNPNDGRDHSLTNACFLLGAGVKGGTIAGSSSDVALTPRAIDLETGLADPDGSVPRPEHVLQGLLARSGIGEEADLRVPPLTAIFQPI